MRANDAAAPVGPAPQGAAVKLLGLGLRVFYPEVDGPDILAARVKNAVEAGVDGVNFYNYGLIPARRLDWVGEAVAAISR